MHLFTSTGTWQSPPVEIQIVLCVQVKFMTDFECGCFLLAGS